MATADQYRGRMETRELFWSLTPNAIVLFYVIGYGAIAVFLYGIVRHLVKYYRGRSPGKIPSLGSCIQRLLTDLLTHRTLKKRDRYAGYAHMGIFFGFLIAAAGTATITLEYDIIYPLFRIRFWKGDFYLLFSLILDLGHLALTAGIVMMIWRRAAFKLPRLSYLRSYKGETELRPVAKLWKLEDWSFLVVLLLIELSGFLQEAVGLMVDKPEWAIWSPVGLVLAKAFSGLGMSEGTAASIRGANWWMHGVLALAFTAAIPWYKAKHIIAVIGSLAMRDDRPLSRLPREPEGKDESGVGCMSDFSWKDMLNFDACTKCGRCHEVCPATNAGYPLSPRDLILDLRTYNDKVRGRSEEGVDLIGDIIAPETLWSCRTCGACQEVCPVGIEHPTIIVQMRRHLVEQGEMEPMLQTALDAIANTGNSFGENARNRAAWTRELGFAVKDIRKERADLLWFVGDYASFDPRNQRVSRAFATLLKAAGKDFALLHEGERNAGNDVRRVGEEGLFETLVDGNLAAIACAQPFERIITTDPHSYNTIRNEYPEFGETPLIEHYTSVLADMLSSGQLKVSNPLNKRVTFHDPCHLGRLNGGYDAPREVLRAIGCEVVEMPRNRENSFCCGAGGGRIWMPDPPGKEKPSENRIHEAAALGDIDVFVTCCPKDLTMFEDARKTSGHERDFVVMDIAELVAEAVKLGTLTPENLPPIVERLTDAIASRIADVVSARLEEMLGRFAPPALTDASAVIPLPDRTHPQFDEDTVLQKQQMPAHPAPEPATLPPTKASTPSIEVPIASTNWDNPSPLQPAVFEAYAAPEKTGIRILVTVKNVAKLGDEIRFTADGRDVVSDYIQYELNEWDDSALEQALLLTEANGGGEVVAVCVGPEEAEQSLRKVLAKGADRAVRIWSDGLSNADPLVIARAIAGIAKAEDPDLIFCGTQSADNAHGSTSTALAAILGLPRAVVVESVRWDGRGALTVTRELEGGIKEILTMPTPAVLAIQTGTDLPRYATMKMIKQARNKPLEVVDGSSAIDGVGGYRVRRMYVPVRQRAAMLEGTAEQVAEKIAAIIHERRG
ncbi:heterodisulfide reductase-related iron-sulfur binding cluster [Mesorhizobium sophorae]|uniref:heterodisulfide reductase-related iron-sulfur binding cluster n=1 Tax=Mesorhizobium sophorae TaxID=1300294 RepID=UPI001FDAB32C|nr:heterodisulfide reductase-related iron-sulfur binding cluster [Mesorhizobium sophorae]